MKRRHLPWQPKQGVCLSWPSMFGQLATFYPSRNTMSGADHPLIVGCPLKPEVGPERHLWIRSGLVNSRAIFRKPRWSTGISRDASLPARDQRTRILRKGGNRPILRSVRAGRYTPAPPLPSICPVSSTRIIGWSIPHRGCGFAAPCVFHTSRNR